MMEFDVEKKKKKKELDDLKKKVANEAAMKALTRDPVVFD